MFKRIAVNYSDFGLVKIAAAAPPVSIADPDANTQAILQAYKAAPRDAAIVLLPELSVTSVSAEDLFFADHLRRATQAALRRIADATDERVLVVGAPWWLRDGRLLNCAFACRAGRILGAVPKITLANYEEFYEKRWFVSGEGLAIEVDDELGRFPLGSRQIFTLGDTAFGIEICEDLWAPNAPSIALALGGAEIVQQNLCDCFPMLIQRMCCLKSNFLEASKKYQLLFQPCIHKIFG